MTRRRSSFLLPNVHVPSQTEAADLLSIGKHALHLILIVFFVYVFEDRFAIGILRDDYQPVLDEDGNEVVDKSPPTPAYAIFLAILYISRLATLLYLPQAFCNFCGLVMFNSFKRGVAPKYQTLDQPAVTFRSYTRGLYPTMTQDIARKNLEVLSSSAIQTYRVEIITDMPIGIERDSNLLERVVPRDFRPNVLNRARALQYCLEEPSEHIGTNEWIVHLDEDVILTADAVQGIMNFCTQGKHRFGSGTASYTNSDESNNWLTGIIDAAKIADDLGQTRFQFKVFHKPLFVWEGSYYVTDYHTEKQVGYEKVIAAGTNEDQYFCTIATRLKQSSDYLEGEVYCRSAASLGDQITRRKRTLQGSLSLAGSHNTPFATIQHWASRLAPLTIPSLIFGVFWSVQTFFLLDFLAAFTWAIRAYGYTFGVLRSFSNEMPFKALASLASPLVFVADLFIESTVCVLAVVAKDPNIQGRRKSRASM